jgi:methanogenic corrinoid protein MtbC1
MEELFEKMAETLIAGKMEEVKNLAQEALDKGARFAGRHGRGGPAL